MHFDEPESPKIKILHITDALNGGILTAIKNLTQNQQKSNHYVLWDSHPDTPVPTASELTFNNSRISGGHLSKMRQILKAIKLIKPDVIHLHSSLAGFYGRIIPTKQPVCYSAHAFAFERKDISRIQALIFRLVESILQIVTHTNILFWPIEKKNIKRLFLKKQIVMTDALWSSMLLKIAETNYLPAESSTELLVIGRVAPAKDPEFVVKIRKELTKRNQNWKITWFGACDYEQIRRLKEVGIEGLLWSNNTKNLQEQIVRSRAILITSKWEVGPYTFYETLSLGRNVVVRDLESIKILGVKCNLTVEEFCDEVESLSDEEVAQKSYEEQVKSLLNYFERLSTKNIEDVYQNIAQKVKMKKV